MEQLFTAYPNYLADHFGKSSKAENGIIDKYLESRMKMCIDPKNISKSSSKKYNSNNNNSNISNLKRENIASRNILKSTPAQLANSKASDILENMRKTNPNFHKITNSYLRTNNEFHQFSNKNSIFENDRRKEDAEEDESVYGATFKDSVEHDNEILRKEKYIGEHTYEYNKELEKSEEKDTLSIKDSEDRISWDVNDKVARILKLVQFDDPNECGEKTLYNFENGRSEKEYADYSGNMNVELWTDKNHRYSYYVFFVMVFTIAIGTLLRSTNRLLASIKIFFDMVFVSCWNWAKGVLSPTENNDGNFLLFILCTPVFAFLLVLYAGFSVVYFANRALLSRVPDKIAEQVNLKKIKEFNT